MRFNRAQISLFLLVVFYSVGLFGLGMERSRETFLQLTPFNLLLTAGIFIWANKNYRASFLISFFLMALLGYLTEVIGVKTGLLFGSYHYGPVLGLKLMEVPLIIGINWSLLVFSANGMLRGFNVKPFYRALLAAFLVTCLDVLIEPVAISMNFWTWHSVSVPLQNYLMWFMASLVMEAFIEWRKPEMDKAVSAYVFFTQVVFFGSLNLIG